MEHGDRIRSSINALSHSEACCYFELRLEVAGAHTRNGVPSVSTLQVGGWGQFTHHPQNPATHFKKEEVERWSTVALTLIIQ